SGTSYPDPRSNHLVTAPQASAVGLMLRGEPGDRISGRTERSNGEGRLRGRTMIKGGSRPLRSLRLPSILAPVMVATALALSQAPSEQDVNDGGKPPGQRVLTIDDAKRVEALDKAIESKLKADRWDEAIARAQEVLDLRAQAQGPKHFET